VNTRRLSLLSLTHMYWLSQYGIFRAFLLRYLPTNVYTDDNFTSLQCCFRIFRLLLLYHNPATCKLLDGHRMPPELYASGWFLTAFAQRLEHEDLWKVWDLYVLYDEPHLHHFACLSLLLRGSTDISAASEAFLPEMLMKVSAAIEHLTPTELLADARKLEESTPSSFIALLDRSCWGGNDKQLNEVAATFEKQSLKLVLKAVGSWSCLPIAADEAVG